MSDEINNGAMVPDPMNPGKMIPAEDAEAVEEPAEAAAPEAPAMSDGMSADEPMA